MFRLKIEIKNYAKGLFYIERFKGSFQNTYMGYSPFCSQ